MSLRDAYQERIEAQIEEQKAKLEMLKARAKRAMADGKIMGYEEMNDAEKNIERLKAQLKKFPTATGDALKELKTGIEKAVTDLADSCKKAAAKFGNKEESPTPK